MADLSKQRYVLRLLYGTLGFHAFCSYAKFVHSETAVDILLVVIWDSKYDKTRAAHYVSYITVFSAVRMYAISGGNWWFMLATCMLNTFSLGATLVCNAK